MSKPRHSSGPGDDRTRASSPGLSLRDYVEREFAVIAASGAPTMAEILAELDDLRAPDGPTTDEIVDAIHEARREREEHLDSLWQR